MKITKHRKTASIEDRKKAIGKELSFEASEAYKRLRTNIQFALPLGEDKNCRIIGVTSSLPGEGKSTTAINLSIFLAESGEKVLLIEADLRLPTISKVLDVKPIPGLSDYLVSGDKNLKFIKPVKQYENLHVISAGNLPPNPAELLGLDRMKDMLVAQAKEYNYIIIDLPPISVVTDAAMISKNVDGMLMVVRQNYDKRHILDDSLRFLKYAEARIIGFVFTRAGNQSRFGKSYSSYNEYKKTEKA